MFLDLLFGLRDRVLEPEDMDDPALATEHLHGALSGLSRLNFVSNSVRIVWRPIRRLARDLKTDRLRVLDIATGAGDVPIALWKRAQRAGLSLDIHAIDFSPRSIDFARRRAEQAKTPVAFERRNALTDELPSGFDVVMCSLFLHHLNNHDAVSVLRRMAATARRLMLVSDLRRNRFGLSLAFAAGHLLSRSPVVHRDAVRSVRAAFTPSELREMANQAGLGDVAIARRWPARMLLIWRG